MRIACIGNMNNNFFALTRYLRDRGLEVDLLLLNNEFSHFLPVNDAFDISFMGFTKKLSWGDFTSYKTTLRNTIIQDLQGYDFFIVTDTVPAFMNRVGMKADIFFPHGSDLFKTPFQDQGMKWHQKIRKIGAYTIAKAQRNGIMEAACVNQENTDPFWRKMLVRNRVLHKAYYFGCPFVYYPIYNPEKITGHYGNSAWYKEFKKIRDISGMMIINHAQQVWKTFPFGPELNKGSDNLIRGFAKFVERNSGVNPRLILFDYGPDVDNSRILIRDLGIESYVVWFPLISRKEIMIGLSLADFGCGEFSAGCIGGGTSWEVLCAGKPLLHHMNMETISFRNFTEPYPFINVRFPDQISEALQAYMGNSQPFIDLGRKGSEWYRRNFAENCVDKWVELINVKLRGEDLEAYAINKVISTNEN